MNLSFLATFIRILTHRVEALEAIHRDHRVLSYATQRIGDALAYEIAMLHALITDLNATYTELEAELADQAFENAGR